MILLILLEILFLHCTTGTVQNYTRGECITYLQQRGILPGFNVSATLNYSVSSEPAASITIINTATTQQTTTSVIVNTVISSSLSASPLTVSLINQPAASSSTTTISMATNTSSVLLNITMSNYSSVASLNVSSTVETSIFSSTESLSTSMPTTAIDSLLSTTVSNESMSTAMPTTSVNQSLLTSNMSTSITQGNINNSMTNIPQESSQQAGANAMQTTSTLITTSMGVVAGSVTPSTSVPTVVTSSVTVMVPTKFDICAQLLFGSGNWSINHTFPYHLLTEYGATTTLPPTTTEPQTTTISAEEARRRLCMSYSLWTVDDWFPNCVNPCDSCTHHALNLTDEYFVCYKWLNNTQPSHMLTQEPMILTILMNQFGATINKFKDSFRCRNHPTYRLYDNFLFYSGAKYRYSDLRLPDYAASQFRNKRWHGRNDTIEIPYGNIPRGDYFFEFVMYEKLIEKEIPKEKTRLKEEWPYEHPIITGGYIDPRVEPGLYLNERLEINSVIISFEISPARANPLPGENIISFTHFNRKLINPVCVYWQALDSGQEGVIPTQGYWSNYGVRVFKTNASMTVCRSTHLSSFTVLMEPVAEPEDDKIDPLDALNVFITLISVILLIIYLLAMIMLKCYRNAYSRIYMMLALSVLMAQILFLAGFASRTSWDACTTISTFMQFCHVSVITWVMLESVHQLSRIHYFFNEHTNIDAFYMILGLGLPMGVLVALQGFPYDRFDSLRFCWVYIEGTDMWFFGGPLVILTLVILGLRFLTFLALHKNPEKIKTNINYERAFRSMIASVIIIPTFIALWLFGTVAVRTTNTNLKDVSMIALPLLNVLVAVEILYLYFYRNDEVHDAILEEKGIREKQKIFTYAHLRGLDMKVTYKENEDSEEKKQDSFPKDFSKNTSSV